MKHLAAVLTIIALGTSGLLTYGDTTNAGAGEKVAGKKTIEGELLKIEGENYVVKDLQGKQVRLRVDKDTRKAKDIQVGDRIEAQADASGRATSIKTSSIADPCNLNPNLPVCPESK